MGLKAQGSRSFAASADLLHTIVAAMSVPRVAAGAGAALLVVGAVVVFKPSSRLSAESFVSAAFTNHGGVSVVGNSAEISKLPVCPALTAALKTATGAFTNPTTTAWVPNADGSEWLYVMEKPCICGAFAATTGRVCEATGNANPKGQSYRPRCDDNAIPTAYTAGCWCGADDVFTTANTDKSAGPGMTMGVANTDGVVTAEAQVCGTNVCVKGETCANAANTCTAADTTTKVRVVQKYAWAIPKIVGYDDKKIKVCMSTNLQKKKCTLTTATAQTPNVPECKDA